MPREGVQSGRRRPQGNQAGDGLVKQVFELANEFCTRCNFGEFPGRMAVLAALVSELAARDARFHPSPRGLQDGGYRLPFPAWSGIGSLSPPPDGTHRSLGMGRGVLPLDTPGVHQGWVSALFGRGVEGGLVSKRTCGCVTLGLWESPSNNFGRWNHTRDKNGTAHSR